LIISLGCIVLKMTLEECITAVTINPAVSLHLDHEVGTLHTGKRADMVVLDIESHRALGYTLGGNPVVMTIKNGAPAVINTSEQESV
jgi:imidazolonepropionase